MSKFEVLILLIVSFLCFSTADIKVFSNTNGGSWNDGSNWNPVGVPQATDSVFINITATITAVGTVNVANVSLVSNATLIFNGCQFSTALFNWGNGMINAVNQTTMNVTTFIPVAAVPGVPNDLTIDVNSSLKVAFFNAPSPVAFRALGQGSVDLTQTKITIGVVGIFTFLTKAKIGSGLSVIPDPSAIISSITFGNEIYVVNNAVFNFSSDVYFVLQDTATIIAPNNVDVTFFGLKLGNMVLYTVGNVKFSDVSIGGNFTLGQNTNLILNGATELTGTTINGLTNSSLIFNSPNITINSGMGILSEIKVNTKFLTSVQLKTDLLSTLKFSGETEFLGNVVAVGTFIFNGIATIKGNFNLFMTSSVTLINSAKMNFANTTTVDGMGLIYVYPQATLNFLNNATVTTRLELNGTLLVSGGKTLVISSITNLYAGAVFASSTAETVYINSLGTFNFLLSGGIFKFLNAQVTVGGIATCLSGSFQLINANLTFTGTLNSNCQSTVVTPVTTNSVSTGLLTTGPISTGEVTSAVVATTASWEEVSDSSFYVIIPSFIVLIVSSFFSLF